MTSMGKRSSWAVWKSVIFALILRELRARFRSGRWGWFWFLFEPLAYLGLMLVIFTAIRGRHLPGVEYPILLLVGVVFFVLFKNISLRGMDAVDANRALFAYRQIKPIDTIISRAFLEAVVRLSVYTVLIAVLYTWFGFHIYFRFPLRWMAAFGSGLALSFGLALIFTVLIDKWDELRIFIRMAYMPMYFMTGIIIPVWAIPQHLHKFLLWNPYLHIIEELRYSSIEYYPYFWYIDLPYASKISLVVLAIGGAMYTLRRHRLVTV